MVAAAGTFLGRYEIRASIGKGGMGEVYLAQDTRLDRPVALKLLSGDMSKFEDRLSRFEQEARAASALNHPNILTIYEIGHSDSGHFIATEFIEGETLRQHITKEPIKIAEALDITLQVAAALTAAHAAGIVHRDIKPENIMLRRDGYVKVLDFGLVKLTERQAIDPEAPTISPIKTDPGSVMGTICYMSPEQVRGLAVDARTDIWSLGVMLYEMVTGRRPFVGTTNSDVIVSILDREPLPLAHYSADVPAELEWIVKKALAKDREERYQTIKDLAIDLRRLKHELEFKAKLERSNSSGEGSVATTSGGQAIESGKRSRLSTQEMASTPTTSSVEYLITEIKRHKGSAALTLGAALIVLIAIPFGLYEYIKRPHPSVPFQNMRISRLTNTGRASDAAISPDGKYVVHVVSEAGQQSLWVRQVVTSSNVQIVPPAQVKYLGLTFSPDENYVYYTMLGTNPPAALYQVPVLGGESRKLIDNVEGSASLSPDGKQIAFTRWHYPSDGEMALLIANVDGTGERKLVTLKLPDSLMDPVWSPDSKIIASSIKSQDANGHYMSVIGVRMEDGVEIPISTQRWLKVGRVAWLRDGSGLVMTAVDELSRVSQVWHLSYPGCETRRITNDLNDYVNVNMTADSSALVTVQKDHLSNIWIVADGGAGRAKQITSGKYNGSSGLSWTPDGKIVYTSNASGSPDIWIMDADGSHQKQLTANARGNYIPSVSPDGRFIVFVSERTGTPLIWRMNIDGTNLKQLNTSKAGFLNCSPDSKWVVYESYEAGKWTLWKVPMDGGNPVQLTKEDSYAPAVSPDGRWIAFIFTDKQANWQRKLAIMPFEGGPPTKTFEVPPYVWLRIKWTADGRALTYIDTRDGASNIWSQPVEGGPPKQVTDFEADQIFWFDWSQDGKQLAISRGLQINDVVLINDLNK